jgi:hypothetical protein
VTLAAGVLAGAATTVAGVAMIYVPAALVLAGLALAFFCLTLDVDRG